jgi:hypothetical protein
MRNKILFHILACGMLACTPDSEKGEKSSGTVNEPGGNTTNVVGETAPDSNNVPKSGATGKEMAPPDHIQSNEGSQTSGTAGH